MFWVLKNLIDDNGTSAVRFDRRSKVHQVLHKTWLDSWNQREPERRVLDRSF